MNVLFDRCTVLPAALAALLVVAAPGLAATYKWVDENGNVQFSDRPPDVAPASGYEGPKQRTVGEALEAEREAAKRQREEERARQRAEQTEAPQGAVEEAPTAAEAQTIESKYTCEEAKQYLAQYSRRDGNLFVPGPDGSFRKATAEDLDRIIAGWQEATRLLCKEPAEESAAGS